MKFMKCMECRRKVNEDAYVLDPETGRRSKFLLWCRDCYERKKALALSEPHRHHNELSEAVDDLSLESFLRLLRN